MSKEWAKQRKINRTDWPAGPWDNEPDFEEWTTTAGYPAFVGRLDSGCWYGIVEAPYPTEDTMPLAFLHTIREKTQGRLGAGAISKTN